MLACLNGDIDAAIYETGILIEIHLRQGKIYVYIFTSGNILESNKIYIHFLQFV